MATMNAPVELPATQMSSTATRPSDIYDRNWIPVLTGPVQTQPEGVSQFPSRTSSRPVTPKESIDPRRDRTRSGFPPTELEAGPIPLASALRQLPLPSKSSSLNPRRQSYGASSDSGRSLETDRQTFSTGAPSTIGTQSLFDDQVYAIPGNNMPKDELSFPAIPLSTRSSRASIKRPAVPTSKYSRKPVTSPIAIQAEFTSAEIQSPPISRSQTPFDSASLQTANSVPPSPMPRQQTTPVLPQEPAPIAVPPKLSYAKSTASERKARALHSHPSIPSIKEGFSTPSPVVHPAIQSHRRRKSTDSRKSSIYDSQPPSAAPQEPLPDLPSEARKSTYTTSSRPPTRDRQPTRDQSPLRQQHSPPRAPPEAYIPRAPSRLRTHDVGHKELADFMTTKNTVIFRRFDDVHVRLLLRLQDEISALERELADLEDSDHPDTDSRNVKVMGELRRLLAEYDHLFSNWKLMQSNKASESLKSDLESWLRKPGESNNDNGRNKNSNIISNTAREDLAWLKDSSDDLSSIQVGNGNRNDKSYGSGSVATDWEKSGTSTNVGDGEKDRGDDRKKSVSNSRSDRNHSTTHGGGGGGGGGGFAAFFGCAGKRK